MSSEPTQPNPPANAKPGAAGAFNVPARRSCRRCGAPLGPRSRSAVCPRCALRSVLSADAPPTEVDSESSPESVRPFGEYQIDSEIGRGGMGVIYKARHTGLNRWVALKVMTGGEFASAELKQRFRTEAQAAAVLDHPNIIPIYEVGEENGRPYFSMRLVEGGTLTASAAVAAPSSKDGTAGSAALSRMRAVARSGATLARAVQYAHDRGVLHRDLKPNNVLVDSAGDLFLTDFGLARLIDMDSSLTRTIAVLGTPGYMAPEQARGNARQLTTGADVYGLGAILYELIAGRPPFVGPTPLDVIHQVLEQEPVAPSVVVRKAAGSGSGSAGLDSEIRDLNTICLKCLEKDPARRYASAAALADDLERWLRHEPILARQASWTERLHKWVRRKPAWAALIFTVAASVVAIGLGSILFMMQLMQARMDAEQANRKLSRDLFVREWQDAEAMVMQDNTAGALMWFARAVRQQPNDLTLTTRLLSLLSEHAFPLPQGPNFPHDAAVRTVDLSPDDSLLLTSDAAGLVRCWSVSDGKLLFTVPQIFEQPGALFVPGTDQFLVTDSSSVSLWPTEGGAQPREVVACTNLVTYDLSRDGRTLALAWADGSSELWDARTLRPIAPRMGDAKIGAKFLRLSPDGRTLLRHRDLALCLFDPWTGRMLWQGELSFETPDWAFAKADFTGDGRSLVGYHTANVTRGKFAVWDLNLPTGHADGPVPLHELPRVVSPLNVESTSVRLSRDSTRAFIATRSGLVHIRSTSTGERAMESIEHAGAVAEIAVSRRRDWIATASGDQTVQLWDIAMRLPEPVVIPNTAAVWDALFSPDGSWLAMSGSDAVQIHDTTTGRLRHRLPMPSFVRHLAVSPDGRRLAAATYRDGVVVWDTTAGAVVSRFEPGRSNVSKVVFSPDGTRVAACIEGQMFVGDSATGKRFLEPLNLDTMTVSAQFSPDGRQLAGVTTAGLTTVWDLPEAGDDSGTPDRLPQAVLRPGWSRHDGVVWEVQFSSDGRWLLTPSNDRTARLWDVATGRVLREFRHEKPVYVARFSPDGRRIMTGGADRTARIWELETGRAASEPMRHPGAVWYGEFSPDGTRILTGDDLGHARLWNPATGLPLNGWVKHGSSLKRVRLSADSRLALSASVDQGVRVWRPLLAPVTAPGWLPDLAEAVARHRLNEDGTLQSVPSQALDQLRERLAVGSPAGFYSRWARWFLVDRMQPNPPAFQDQNGSVENH